ncbi:hypothetical protein [Dryocola clanedunensis]|uniref:hypothetical protein n=1 Tax=Cedecea sulfonylureivorans TaxID=3051154 RepID=UPI0019277802|nr:hypothetical protein [Cedecea sulfonylureivorans]
MERDSKQKRFAIIFPVITAFLGAFVTALFGWYGSYLQASAISTTACIARVDKQEAQLREKYKNLMVSITEFAFSPGLTQPMTRSELRQQILPVVTSATEVMVYAPSDMAIVALRIMMTFYSADKAGNDPLLQEEAIKQATESPKGSYKAYLKALETLDSQRIKCH